jgi:hypothetical protein
MALGFTDELPNPNADALNANEGVLFAGSDVRGQDGPAGALPNPAGANERGIFSELVDRCVNICVISKGAWELVVCAHRAQGTVVTGLLARMLRRMDLVVPHDNVPFLNGRDMLGAFLERRSVCAVSARVGWLVSRNCTRHLGALWTRVRGK